MTEPTIESEMERLSINGRFAVMAADPDRYPPDCGGISVD